MKTKAANKPNSNTPNPTSTQNNQGAIPKTRGRGQGRSRGRGRNNNNSTRKIEEDQEETEGYDNEEDKTEDVHDTKRIMDEQNAKLLWETDQLRTQLSAMQQV